MYSNHYIYTQTAGLTDPDPLQGWKEQLSQRGMVLSKQRLLIMHALFHQPVFEDIEAIWMDLRNEHQISWAAFYSFIRVAIKEKWIIKYGDKISESRFGLRIN